MALLAGPDTLIQRWAEGPIIRSSDTDSIFRLYRPTQSIDFEFRFLYRAIVSVRFKVRFLYRAIVSVPFKVRFLYRAIVSVCFKVRFFNRPILFFGLGSDYCIDRFYRNNLKVRLFGRIASFGHIWKFYLPIVHGII